MSRAASAKIPKSRLSMKSASKPAADGDDEMVVACYDLRPDLRSRPKTAAIVQKNKLKYVQAGPTKEEQQKLREAREAEIQKLELESKNRKRSLQELDAIRNEKFGKEDDEFAEEKLELESKLLNRAVLAKHEQVSFTS